MLPVPLRLALEMAAQRDHVSLSEAIRRALVAGLGEDVARRREAHYASSEGR